MVIVVTPDHKAISTYDELSKTLEEKYGKPSDRYRHFTTPYFEGDGYEQQAIRLGKGLLASYWIGGEGSQKEKVGALGLSVTEKLTVLISYESAEWKRESDKRRAKRDQIF